MKRRIRFAGLLLGGLSLLAAGCATLPAPIHAPSSTSATRVQPRPAKDIQTVVVDAGHGGHDPGTSHYGLREKDMVLDIARRVASELGARGMSAVLTRDTDEFLPLSRRPAVANRARADLFVSVHVNANPKRHVSGVEVYYPRESQVTDATALPPSVRPSEVALPTTTIKRVLWDVTLSRTRSRSVQLASTICRTMRAQLGVRCRGIRGARFVVLRESQVPAVLVEVGYVTNRQEAQRLGQPEYRQRAAQAIAEGIAAYLREQGVRDI